MAVSVGEWAPAFAGVGEQGLRKFGIDGGRVKGWGFRGPRPHRRFNVLSQE